MEKKYLIDNKELMKEWNYEKNKDFDPKLLTCGSGKRVWWICSKGHEWQTRINHRSEGQKCPMCNLEKRSIPKREEDTLLFKYPQLANEWNWNKNNGLSPSNITIGSNKKIWWRCEKGHEWKASISNRVRGTNCPYCSGRYAISGTNDFATIHPELMREWNWEKNVGINPNEMKVNSGQKVWWKCSKGHEWQTTISSRSIGTNCPYCTNQKILPGYNDLLTINPKLAKEWNYEKNKDLLPTMVGSCSSKKVWWKCSKGHEWQTAISSRDSGTNCPYCTNSKLLSGYNDLETVKPDLAKEWNYEKNNGLLPSQILAGSAKKVWWKCSNNHEYESTIDTRNQGSGCPYCTNQKVLVGYNDLNTSSPIIAKEWHPTKNGNLKSTDVVKSSNKIVWWKCSKGHEWQASVNNRTKTLGSNCPICFGENQTSFPEQALYFYIKNIFPNAISRWKLKDKYEADIYIPEYEIAIEYDGSYYHKNNVKKENEKNTIFEKNKITLIRVKEEHDGINKESFENISVQNIIYCKSQQSSKSLNETICKTISRIEKIINKTLECNVDIDRDANAINESYIFQIKSNSLSEMYPELVKEWNYEKNKGITPSVLNYGTRKKVWWKCSKGHEWQTSVNSRTNRKSNCPYCSGRYVICGVNDLETLKPDLAKDWNYSKNNGLLPNQVAIGSSKKVWWKCSKGHEWQARINSRSNGTNCPYCTNQKILEGYNDLMTINPILAREWNYEKNGSLTPKDVGANARKKVWWKCENGHEWQAYIYSRNTGCGCPICYKEERRK